MIIEADSRKYVVDMINAECGLKQAERENISIKVEHAKSLFVKSICSINAIANVDGKGRDDFEVQTLQSAEHVLASKTMAAAVK